MVARVGAAGDRFGAVLLKLLATGSWLGHGHDNGEGCELMNIDFMRARIKRRASSGTPETGTQGRASESSAEWTPRLAAG
jgi:hypothetical protein